MTGGLAIIELDPLSRLNLGGIFIQSTIARARTAREETGIYEEVLKIRDED